MEMMKPTRPFGLTLAVLVGVLIFAIIPLIQVGFVFSLSGYQYQSAEGGISGIQFSQFNPTPYLVQAGMAFLFLVISALTLYGRPRVMRFLFPLAVVGLSVLIGMQAWTTFNATTTVSSGIDSAESMRRTVALLQLIAVSLISFYSVWFCNRWSARAFFRGHYTEQDVELIRATQEGVPQ